LQASAGDDFSLEVGLKQVEKEYAFTLESRELATLGMCMITRLAGIAFHRQRICSMATPEVGKFVGRQSG